MGEIEKERERERGKEKETQTDSERDSEIERRNPTMYNYWSSSRTNVSLHSTSKLTSQC